MGEICLFTYLTCNLSTQGLEEGLHMLCVIRSFCMLLHNWCRFQVFFWKRRGSKVVWTLMHSHVTSFLIENKFLNVFLSWRPRYQFCAPYKTGWSTLNFRKWRGLHNFLMRKLAPGHIYMQVCVCNAYLEWHCVYLYAGFMHMHVCIRHNRNKASWKGR